MSSYQREVMYLPQPMEFKNYPAKIALIKRSLFTEPKEDPVACASPRFTPRPEPQCGSEPREPRWPREKADVTIADREEMRGHGRGDRKPERQACETPKWPSWCRKGEHSRWCLSPTKALVLWPPRLSPCSRHDLPGEVPLRSRKFVEALVPPTRTFQSNVATAEVPESFC